MNDSVIVYVITNEYLRNRKGEQVCKIGFTSGSTISDLEKRLGQLYSTSVPERFICNYAVVVDDKKVEKLLHNIFEDYRVNSGREFFDCSVHLVKNAFLLSRGRFIVNQDQDEEITEIEETGKITVRNRTPNQNSFEQLGIPIGSELCWVKDENIKCVTTHGRKVLFDGEEYSLSGLTKKIYEPFGTYRNPNGWEHFTFNGRTLYDIWKNL